MNLEKLTQIVEEEVKKALETKLNASKGVGSQPIPTDKRNIYALFTGGSAKVLEAINQIKLLVQNGYNVRVILSESATKVIKTEKIREIPGIEDIFCEPNPSIYSVNIVQSSDAIVVPILTRNSAAKIALGICDTLVTNIIMHALIAGKPVIAARNSADPEGQDCICIGTPQTPPALIQIAKDYLKRLESYGVKLVDVSEIAQYFIGNKNIKRELVTYDTIKELPQDIKQIEIKRGSIITPLAKDLAKERDIKIILID